MNECWQSWHFLPATSCYLQHAKPSPPFSLPPPMLGITTVLCRSCHSPWHASTIEIECFIFLLLIMHCIHRRSRRAIYDRSECVECCGSNTPPPSLPRWHASSAYAFKYAAFSFFLFNRLPPFTRRHSMPHVTTGKCQHRPRPLYSHGMRHLYPP
jgi:hypothetical protein